MELDGARDMQHLGDAFMNRQWWNLVPDRNHEVLTAGYGAYGGVDYVTTAYASDGSLLMAYIPPTGTHAKTLSINMARLSGSLQARWMNPTNGVYTDIGSFDSSGFRDFTSPGNNGDNQNDWLLVLESTPINTPTNLNASYLMPDSVVLTWQDNADNENGFIIQRKPHHGSNDWYQINDVGPDTTQYTDDTDIHGLVNYTYRVGAYQN